MTPAPTGAASATPPLFRLEGVVNPWPIVTNVAPDVPTDLAMAMSEEVATDIAHIGNRLGLPIIDIGLPGFPNISPHRDRRRRWRGPDDDQHHRLPQPRHIGPCGITVFSNAWKGESVNGNGGKIQWLGFSFHDEYSAFEEIVDSWNRWTFCMIFYNYASETVQAGTRGLRYASAKGLAVVVMEPLMGGNLVNPPPPVQSLWEQASVNRSPADWALQWVWSKPEVSLVLSGMSTMAQVEENLASADRSSPGLLNPVELEVVSRVAAAYEKLRPIPCTQCGYCMPCPNGVNIQRILDIYNKSVAFANPAEGKRLYGFLKEAERAGKCSECLECEGKCPQEVPVHEWLSRIKQEFGS